MTERNTAKKGGRQPGAGRPRKDGLLVGAGVVAQRPQGEVEIIRELARADWADREMQRLGWRLDRELYAAYDEVVEEELRKVNRTAAREFRQWSDAGKRWDELALLSDSTVSAIARVRAERFVVDKFAWTHPRDTYPVPHSQAYRGDIIRAAGEMHVTFPVRPAWARPGFRPGETVPDESRVPGRPDGPPAWMAERAGVPSAASPGTPAGQAPAAGLGAAGPAVGGFVLE